MLYYFHKVSEIQNNTGSVVNDWNKKSSCSYHIFHYHYNTKFKNTTRAGEK
nr:MAG TPA: hypothetical protein [Caudoviricetes sp.]